MMKPKILFVDDDKNILASFRSLLRKEFIIDTADHPEKGLQMFRENGPYPVVVSDLKMPDMDGLTFLSEIGKLNEDTIGIILTGHADIQAAVTALNQGYVFRFLTKPTERNTLRNVINAGLEQYKLIIGDKLKARIIHDDLKAAAYIQQSFLPGKRSEDDSIALNWLFRPSDYVGGDMFDLIQLDDDNTGFYLMDISGHGVSAALAAISVSRLLSRPEQLKGQQSKALTSPGELLLQLDEDYPIERMNKHFTMFYGIINKTNKTLHYSSAGHLPPILLRNSGEIEELEKGGSVIGINSGIPFEEEEIDFQEGDRLFVYTDGISEYEKQSKEMFGSERIISIIKENNALDSKSLLDHLYNEVMLFGNNHPLQDDATICCLELAGPAS